MQHNRYVASVHGFNFVWCWDIRSFWKVIISIEFVPKTLHFVNFMNIFTIRCTKWISYVKDHFSVICCHNLFFFLAGSSSHQGPRRLSRVVAVPWLVRLLEVEELKSQCWRPEMPIISTEWRGTPGPTFVVWQWILLSIPMVVVTINILVTPVLFAAMHHLDKRSVLLLLEELGVSVVKLLPPHLNRIRVLRLIWRDE